MRAVRLLPVRRVYKRVGGYEGYLESSSSSIVETMALRSRTQAGPFLLRYIFHHFSHHDLVSSSSAPKHSTITYIYILSRARISLARARGHRQKQAFAVLYSQRKCCGLLSL